MKSAFQLIVLGCLGGPYENNLTGFLLAPLNSSSFIALDAGTLLAGIEIAIKKGSFAHLEYTSPKYKQAGEIFRNHIKAYLITHAHLDHIAGLVINSQADVQKAIIGLDSTIDNLRDFIFNGRIWANFANEGSLADPLNLYQYIRLNLHKQMAIPNTDMQVEAFLLSHPGGYPSTAYLIEHQEKYILYFGDTSSDFLEDEKHLNRIWNRIVPLIKNQQLHAILIECSFPYKHAEKPFYGHLNTKFLLKEFEKLANLSEGKIKNVSVIVIHRKDSLLAGDDPVAEIEEELINKNDLGLRFVFPSQGDRIVI